MNEYRYSLSYQQIEKHFSLTIPLSSSIEESLHVHGVEVCVRENEEKIEKFNSTCM